MVRSNQYGQAMKFLICVTLLLISDVLSATADTNLLTSGEWAVDGTTDLETNASLISVAVGRAAPVMVSELKFFFSFDGRNLVQVFSVTGRGTLRPSLPPPGEAGGAFQLGSYRDCEAGLVGPLAVTDIVLPTKVKKNGILQLSGALANGTSLRGDKFVMKFLPPQTNLVRVDVQCRLVATRDFCVDQSAAAEQDKFRTVTMTADYLSPTDYDSDLVRFVRTTEKTCFGLWGCYVRHQSDCVSLMNQVPGYLIDKPYPLGNPWLLLAHTTATPRVTPTLQVAIRAPSGIRPQGYLDGATVEVWSNWAGVKKSYKARQTVMRLNCSLEATPPQSIGCDWVQP